MLSLLIVSFVALLSSPCHGVEKVAILRHCARTSYPTLFPDHGAPGFDDPSNYTARPFPTLTEWGVEDIAECTARGRSIAQALGKSLRVSLPNPISAIADETKRCVQTMDDIAMGLNMPARSTSVNVPIFDPVKAKVCRRISNAEKSSSIQEQLALANTSGSYLNDNWVKRDALLAELQELVGAGVAPPITEIPNHIAEGYYEGGLYVASQGMIETFILEAGAGLPSAWGKLDGSKRGELWSKWMAFSLMFNRINHGGSLHATRLGGATVWHILELLEDPGAGSTIMVGHDTNLDAIAKLADLQWQCGPFTPNGTPPVGGLLFTRDGENIYIEALCTPFDGDAVGSVMFGPVDMSSQRVSQSPVSLSSLKSTIKDKIDFSCISEGHKVPVFV